MNNIPFPRMPSVVLVFALMQLSFLANASNESAILRIDEDERLVALPVNDRGDRIIDFSNVGYMGGGVKIPDAPVVKVLHPSEGDGDDAPRIQKAIDMVSLLDLRKDGLRGAVLLKAGTYNLFSVLEIRASGVVLRGEGDSENGTVLVDQVKEKNNFITVSGSGELMEVPDTRQEVTDDYVPSGERVIGVMDGSRFRVGDSVCVFRPGTEEWIRRIGMDRIPVIPGRTKQWKPHDYSMKWERRIVGVEGNKVTLNAPIVEPLYKELGPSYVYESTFDGRISQVGIEYIRLVSCYDESVQDYPVIELVKEGVNAFYPQTFLEKEFTDENHGWNAVLLRSAEDSWVRNVTAVHFGYSTASIHRSSKHVTVQDCSYLEPVSRIVGGRRYSFCVTGQLNLVQRCYSDNGRHDYVLQARTNGPNVFFDCIGENTWNMTEAHHRWSQGALWDNVNSIGKWAWMQAINRSSSGSGHGWTGTNLMFWNCDAKYIIIQQPPIGQNFAIGRNHYRDYANLYSSDKDFRETMNWVEHHALEKFEYEPGKTMFGSGYVESPDGMVEPKSLYLQQLKDRLGMEAVRNVATTEQIKSYLGK